VNAQLRLVVVGHVDHGKSTLIGRLLHDTGNLPDGKLEEVRNASRRRGVPFEWSFLLDALQSERDQAVTIDTTRIWMRLTGRDVVLIDAPGHKEFLRNMVTGASDADAALLVVDAHDGVSEQTRRHALLLELLGVERVVVAVNKMDRVDYSAARFSEIRAELGALLERIGIVPAAFVPSAAREGANVARAATESMPWYDGATLLGALSALPPSARRDGGALRIAVQGVIRRDLERVIVGRIESGTLAVGLPIAISPSRHAARVGAIVSWPPRERVEAHAGESVALTLDAPLFVDRGDVLSDAARPPVLSDAFRARLLWLGARALRAGDTYRLRFGTRTAQVEVKRVDRVFDIETLQSEAGAAVRSGDVAEIVLASPELLALDRAAEHPGLGRFILLAGLDIVAGGTVLEVLPARAHAPRNLVPVAHTVDRAARARRNGHRGAVLWFTGLPASGKSTIAMAVERRLFERGHQTYVLDGDNVRAGLCRDLGFSAADRRENIRRVGEVAALFADAGTIVLAAFISPYRADRAEARRAAGSAFHEVFVKADAELCERRDPKGHYKKARAGELPDFTGVTGEYEEPVDPELVLDSAALSVDEAVDAVLAYVDARAIAFARSGVS
jgi:bifunctional enzyme CysN/CysC